MDKMSGMHARMALGINRDDPLPANLEAMIEKLTDACKRLGVGMNNHMIAVALALTAANEPVAPVKPEVQTIGKKRKELAHVS